jgi:hypothetical protein
VTTTTSEQSAKRRADPVKHARGLAKARARYRERLAEEPGYRDIIRRHRTKDPQVRMLSLARRRARKLGVEFSIGLEDLPFPTHCPVLGLKLERGTRGSKSTSPSLDRVDSSKGYVKGNVYVISMRANWMKHNATPDEALAIYRYICRGIGIETEMDRTREKTAVACAEAAFDAVFPGTLNCSQVEAAVLAAGRAVVP